MAEHERLAEAVLGEGHGRERGRRLRIGRREDERTPQRVLRAGEVGRVRRLAPALLQSERVPRERLGVVGGRAGAVLAHHAAECEGGGGECRRRPCEEQPSHDSYPWWGVARYGNCARNGLSFASTPSPSMLFGVRFALPPQKPKLSTIGPTTGP